MSMLRPDVTSRSPGGVLLDEVDDNDMMEQEHPYQSPSQREAPASSSAHIAKVFFTDGMEAPIPTSSAPVGDTAETRLLFTTPTSLAICDTDKSIPHSPPVHPQQSARLFDERVESPETPVLLSAGSPGVAPTAHATAAMRSSPLRSTTVPTTTTTGGVHVRQHTILVPKPASLNVPTTDSRLHSIHTMDHNDMEHHTHQGTSMTESVQEQRKHPKESNSTNDVEDDGESSEDGFPPLEPVMSSTTQLLQLCHCSFWDPDPVQVAKLVSQGADVFCKDDRRREPLLVSLFVALTLYTLAPRHAAHVHTCNGHSPGPSSTRVQRSITTTATSTTSTTFCSLPEDKVLGWATTAGGSLESAPHRSTALMSSILGSGTQNARPPVLVHAPMPSLSLSSKAHSPSGSSAVAARSPVVVSPTRAFCLQTEMNEGAESARRFTSSSCACSEEVLLWWWSAQKQSGLLSSCSTAATTTRETEDQNKLSGPHEGTHGPFRARPTTSSSTEEYGTANGIDMLHHHSAPLGNVLASFVACLQTPHPMDFRLTDGFWGRTLLHTAVSARTLPHITAYALKAMIHRLETHPEDVVDWGQKDWDQSDVLSLAARYQKLSVVWPLVKSVPYFADKVEPIPLPLVWAWDWEALGPAEQVFFSVGGVENAGRLRGPAGPATPRPGAVPPVDIALPASGFGVLASPDRATCRLLQVCWVTHWRPPLTLLDDAVCRCGAAVQFLDPESLRSLLVEVVASGQLQALRICLQSTCAIDFTVLNGSSGRGVLHVLTESRDDKSAEVMQAMLDAIIDRVEAHRDTDVMDWGQKDRSGDDFISLAAVRGKLSLVWGLLKRRRVRYFFPTLSSLGSPLAPSAGHKVRRRAASPAKQKSPVSSASSLSSNDHRTTDETIRGRKQKSDGEAEKDDFSARGAHHTKREGGGTCGGCGAVPGVVKPHASVHLRSLPPTTPSAGGLDPIRAITLTQRMNRWDWGKLSEEDQKRFDPAQGFF